jgi:hypothetical protein
MLDGDGVISDNVRPIKYSTFLEDNKNKIEIFNKEMIEAGVNIIDLSQNQCW